MKKMRQEVNDILNQNPVELHKVGNSPFMRRRLLNHILTLVLRFLAHLG